MAISQYYTLRLFKVRRELEDSVVGAAYEMGAAGFSEVLNFHQTPDNYDPTFENPDEFDLDIYFTEPPSAGLVEDIANRSQAKSYEFMAEENKDWREEWKKGLQPFQLASNYWVVPSWCEVPKEADVPLFIDPGMAFGTGTHETTRVVSELILKHLPELGSWTALDVGTGTGILAMMLSNEGASQIVATEIDRDAAKTAEENIEANRWKNISVTTDSLDRVQGHFDIVVANIIDGVLRQLKEDLLSRVNAGGKIILSGILTEREDGFRESFDHPEFEQVDRIQKGDWVGLVYERSSS